MQKLCVNMLNDSRYIALITVLDYEILWQGNRKKKIKFHVLHRWSDDLSDLWTKKDQHCYIH